MAIDNEILIVVIAYFALLAPITWYTARRTKRSADFFVAGRNLDKWTTMATISATTIGGSATIAATSLVYQVGLPGMWMDIAAGIGLILLALLLARKVRELRVFSLPEILEKTFSRETRLAASIVVIMAEVAWLALTAQAAQFVVSVTIGADADAALIATMAVIIGYTIIGGQHTVAHTDVFQFAIMMIGLCVITAPMAVWSVLQGGYDGALFDGALDFPTNTRYGPVAVIGMFLLMALPHMVGSDIYSKVFSAKNGDVAVRATMSSGIIKFAFGLLVGVLGISALLLYPGLPSGGMALPQLIIGTLRPVSPLLAGVVVAALLATMMSSADSILLTGSTVVANDIWHRHFRRKAGDREVLQVSRAATFAIGLIAFMIAYDNQSNIIKTLELGYTVFVSGIILPVLAAFHKERLGVTPLGATAAIIAGAATAIYLLEVAEVRPYELDPVIWGIVVCALYMFVISWADSSGRVRPNIPSC